jgi:curved DNA-binding protein CbpA
MSFIDYYAILNISIDANQSAIKTAFKEQAIKWHPDKNIGHDTTQRMQLINEAYLILKDIEARKLFDVEYRKYTKYQSQSKSNQEQKNRTQSEQENNSEHKNDDPFEDKTYEIFDDVLKKWMDNARSQAVSLAKQTIDDIRGMSKVSGQAMAEAALGGVFKYIALAIIVTIIFKACQH